MRRELGSILSRTINVIFFGGTADWTASGRAYRDRRAPVWARRMRWIDAVFGKHHCAQWYLQEIARSRTNVRLHEAFELHETFKPGDRGQSDGA